MKLIWLACSIFCSGLPIARAETMIREGALLKRTKKGDIANYLKILQDSQALRKARAENIAKLEKAKDAPQVDAALSSLHTLLDRLHYEDAAEKLMGPNYPNNSIFDQDFRSRLTSFKGSAAQNVALRLFMFGQAIPKAQANALLFNTPETHQTFANLKAAGLINEGKTTFSMNRVSVVPYPLPSPDAKVMYILSDQPESVSHEKGGSGEVSTTSHILLGAIETVPPGSLTGNGADFGSGVGIQSIALLKTQPAAKVYALEIDAHAMNLSRLNAKLNGVESRFDVIDNSDTNRLSQALGSKRLDFAVSNPPFNIVPAKLKGEFDAYGEGGPEGLDVTRIFLRQLKDTLNPRGSFSFYSQLARDAGGHYVVESDISTILGQGYKTEIVECDFPRSRLSRDVYAQAFAGYMTTYIATRRSAAEIESITKQSLTDSNIAEIVPAIVTITRNDNANGAVTKSKSAQCAGPVLANAFGPPPVSTAARASQPKVVEGIGIKDVEKAPEGGVYIQTEKKPRGQPNQ